MNTPIVEYEGDQLEIDFSEIDFDLDRPQFSICPACASQVIKFMTGCDVCGWSENESQSPPSKIPPTKQRRKKGDGTGYLYSRTITRRGKQYQESYYRYRDESGKLRSKYIPQKLLDRVLQAESRKLTVTDVLKLLGVFEISRGEQSSTFDDGKVPNSESDFISRGEQANTPSTKRRKYGDGGGYIECKPITKNGLEYKQYWFHWQVWRDGETVIKKSRYIPKRRCDSKRTKNNAGRIIRII